MTTTPEINHPEPEGIFRYYTSDDAPWDYFQGDGAPAGLLMDRDELFAVTAGPQLVSQGADVVSTGRRELTVYCDDEDFPAHPLQGTVYDTDEDALRAAYEAGLMVFRVQV